MNQSIWQPKLEGSLIQLRPLIQDDFDALYTAGSDPAIWEQHPERNRYKRENFLVYFRSGIESGGALAIVDKRTERVIGSSRFSIYDVKNSTVEIGYTFLTREYWGEGYNGELKKLMLNHAFNFVNKVHFYIGQKNLRSRRAIEKLGASLVEIQSRNPDQDDTSCSAVYEITRLAWRDAQHENQNRNLQNILKKSKAR